ncbi:MAG: S-formylglutathione hydrolase [Burkholderiaceae bacterium]
MPLQEVSANKSFGGTQFVYRHDSVETGTSMRFGAYLPPQAQAQAGKVPVLYWLSGLTCTEENFIVKAGAQRMAAELGLAIIAPDTSPRGLGYPGEDDAYDFGSGAGFYVDATVEPWASGYRMASYVSEELPALVTAGLPVDAARCGIFGHSMGGHGALTLALKHPDRFRSVSAFSPIVAPAHVPWGQKALAGYLGEDREAWKAYDATELVRARGWSGPPLLIEQGEADPFLASELRPELLEAACADAGVALTVNRRAGYDHSYFFIASFIDDHLRFHAANLP